MAQTEVDALKERNNFVTVSDFTTITAGSLGRFNTKPIFVWQLDMDSDEEWIKINNIKTVILKSFEINYDLAEGSGSNDNIITIETSFDNWNWKEIWSGNQPPNINDQDYTEEAVFIRIRFNNMKRGFKIQDLSFKVLDDYENTNKISFFSEGLIPEKIRETYPMMEDFIRTYLEMLENNVNEDEKIIKDYYYMTLLTGADRLFAINIRAVDTHPIDGLPQRS